MTLRGIDISNLQGFPATYRGQAWYQAAQFVIVQAIAPPAGYLGHGTDISAQQLRAARDDGKKTGAYVWLWNVYSGALLKADIAFRLSLIPDDVHLDMRVWLDVEDTTRGTVADRRQDILGALGVIDTWSAARGLPPGGMYSGGWYVRDYLGGWFPPNRMYWMADYTISPTVNATQPVHQYSSTPIDSDIMSESEIVMSVPQDYRDKFGQDVTWAGVAANLEGIIHSLQDQLNNSQAETELIALNGKLDQIRAVLAA